MAPGTVKYLRMWQCEVMDVMGQGINGGWMQMDGWMVHGIPNRQQYSCREIHTVALLSLMHCCTLTYLLCIPATICNFFANFWLIATLKPQTTDSE